LRYSSRLAQRCIDLADGDAQKGNLILGSPLTAAITFRGIARCLLGLPGWKDDIDRAITMARAFDPTMRALVLLYGYGLGISNAALLLDAGYLRETAEMLELAERCGDDFTLVIAQFLRGVALVRQGGAERAEGFDLLGQARDGIVQERCTKALMSVVEFEYAKEKVRTGDLAGGIELSRSVVDRLLDSGEIAFSAAAVTVLVESLLARGTDADLQEAQVAIDRLAAVPTEPGFIVYEVALLGLRALLARAHGDQASYRRFADSYRETATSLGMEGHMAMAEAMR
jgi:adenylate cyclase